MNNGRQKLASVLTDYGEEEDLGALHVLYSSRQCVLVEIV